ncbi:MAG: hypothetical protein ACRCYE_00565 [Sarcina sp.]
MNYRFRKLLLFIQLIFSFPLALACFVELSAKASAGQTATISSNKQMSLFIVVILLIMLSIIFDRVFSLWKLSKHEDILRKIMWIFQIIMSAILSLEFLGSMVALSTTTQFQNMPLSIPSLGIKIMLAITLFFFISVIVENIYFYTAKKYR